MALFVFPPTAVLVKCFKTNITFIYFLIGGFACAGRFMEDMPMGRHWFLTTEKLQKKKQRTENDNNVY